MRKFIRIDSPAILVEVDPKTATQRWVSYGDRYKKNRVANPGFSFQWPTVQGIPINQHILSFLRLQTSDHCSYCDSYPLKKGDNSIDHFFPKSDANFYEIVCQWENLYYACTHCQHSKSEKVSLLTLRPDESYYTFYRYFTYNYYLHFIEVNPLSSLDDQDRALETIHFFDFNHTAMVISRRHAFERYNKAVQPILEDYNFRFMFE